MKLLLENWRKYLDEEKELDEVFGLGRKAKWEKEAEEQSAEAGEDTSPGIDTVGDLRKVWAKRRSGELASELVQAIPAIGSLMTLKDVGSLFKKLYMADDDFEDQPGLDALSINPRVSKIVDDKIELAFIRELIGKFEGAPDEQKLTDFKSTELIQNFIAKKFDGITVKK